MPPVPTTVSPPKKDASRPAPSGPPVAAPREHHWVDALAEIMERIVPDAITTSIILLVILFGLSLGLGTGLTATMDAYYRGLWMLLQFTMQMTLILVLSLILGATPTFKNAVIFLSRLPRTQAQVMVLAVVAGGFVAYLNWGLSIALSPVIAIHFATQAERKGIKIDFLWLMSVLAGGGAIWQFGLSGSAPLLMATPGNFLEQQAGVMPLTTTIWSPAALILVPSFMAAVVIVGVVFMPKKPRQVSEFPQAARVVAERPFGGDGRNAAGRADLRAAARVQPDRDRSARPRAGGLDLPSLLRQEPQPRHQLRQHDRPAARPRPARQRPQLHQGDAARGGALLADRAHVSRLRGARGS